MTGTSTDVVDAVVRALISTHANHGWIVGTPREDGLTPLWLDGGGEFQDHNWLIAADGSIHDGDR